MKFVIGVIIFGVFFVGCGNNVHTEVRKLRQEMRIGRLDRDVFSLDTLSPDLEALHRDYGRYFKVYAEGVLNLGNSSDSAFCSLFRLFIQDPVMREVADSVALRYPDMRVQEERLAQAFAYYRYYFPGHVVPRVYAHISGFNQSVIVDSAAVGVSLDNYLGEKCVFYNMLAVPVPMYARKKMNALDISRDVMAGWLSTEFPFRPEKNDLVSGMIYQGKMVFVLRKLFPDEPLHWLLGFTLEQTEWCVNNEEQIWGFLIENDYLFTSQQRLIMKYLSDAPYTSGMPIESPGKTVVWTGLRIVEKYMNKTKMTLEELMREQDYHKILRVAGYRP
ncbi:MAG: hypothetical protein K2O69_00870 [Odoribacter sp.]|nr:hypothetical protein [Odoribacter sp.]